MENVLGSARPAVLMAETGALHHQLMTRANQNPSSLSSVNPDTPKLMPFNGYYALGKPIGAFFAVDTNMVVFPGSAEPIFQLSLIVSLDGTKAASYAFTGTFDGTTLIQKDAAGFSLELVFSRPAGANYGPTAYCAGSVTLPGQPAACISGSTYNNPISANLFSGDYYVTTPNTTPIKVLSIGSDYQLLYDYGSNNGQLLPVTTFAYNMNMYFFSLLQGDDQVALIMGTAANKGFACNNMTTTGASRSLLTIPCAPTITPEIYDLAGCVLADFSGYYAISNAASPKAFLSIQAQYATLLPNTELDLNFVMISVSMDGVSSQGYYFNPFTMSFDGATLKMPRQGISLTLTRQYDSATGSLVSMSGMVNQQSIRGSTPFNPVPLSVFGGLPLTNDQNDKLVVNSDNSVTYNGTLMNSIIYVPLMYILAYPVAKPTVVMSFGTDGTHGNACIVTINADTPTPTVTVVQAIPS